MRQSREYVLHPLLVAVFPVAFLLAHNADEVPLTDVLLPALLSLLLAGAVLAVGRWWFRTTRRAGLFASSFLLVFYSYGRVVQALRDVWPTRFIIIGVLVGAVALFLLALVVWFLLTARPVLSGFTAVMNIIGVALLAVPVLSYAVASFASSSAPQVPALLSIENSGRIPVHEEPRDIYYIILDRYAGSPALREIFSFDNSRFENELRVLGFDVLPYSRCNYARTDMSLASSLNMSYLNDAITSENAKGMKRMLHSWISDYEAWRFLSKQGYQLIHFGSWWRSTSFNRKATRNVNRLLLTEFSMMLYKTTLIYPIGALLGFDSQGEQWRRVRFQLGELEKLPTVGCPKFVFVHFLVPHEGYVFDSDGCFQSRYRQAQRDVNSNYIAQLTYLNGRLTTLVRRLLETSRVPPVIILQADEGPRPSINFQKMDTASTLRARFSILMALHLPGVELDTLASVVSPVNVLRVVLNGYFDAGLALLPDSSYEWNGNRFDNMTTLVGYDSVLCGPGFEGADPGSGVNPHPPPGSSTFVTGWFHRSPDEARAAGRTLFDTKGLPPRLLACIGF